MKKKALKIMAAVIAVLVVLALCGCAASEERAAKEAAENGLKQLQKADLDKATDYLGGLDDAEKTLSGYEKYGVDYKKLVKAVFGNLEYKIKDAKQKSDSTVNVSVEVTNVDMKKAVSSWADQVRTEIADSDSDLVKAYVESLDSNESGADKYKKVYKIVFDMLSEKIENEDSKKTQDITVKARKQKDGNYKLDLNESQVNKIAGNLKEAFDDVQSDFSL